MEKCGFNTFLRSLPSLTCQPAERGVGIDHLPAVGAVGVNEHHAVIECVKCTLQVAVGGGKLGVVLGLGLEEGEVGGLSISSGGRAGQGRAGQGEGSLWAAPHLERDALLQLAHHQL